MKDEPNEATEPEPEVIEVFEPPAASPPRVSSTPPPVPSAPRVGGLASGLPPAPPRPTGLGLGHPNAPPRPTPTVPPVAPRSSVPPLPRPSGVPAIPPPASRPTGTPAIPPPASRPTGTPAIPPAAPKEDPSLAKIAALQAQIEEARRALAAKDGEIRAVLAQRDARIAEVEQLRQELARAAPRATNDVVAERDKLVQEREDLRKECDRLRGDLARAAEQAGELALLRQALADREAERVGHPAPAGPEDDLRRIRGIGPAFERTLKQNGVRTIAQIAAWTDADIAAVASKLRIKPDRIRREGWVESASEIVRAASPA